MYVGNINHIDISSSQFADFITEGNLYVDKTAFIEHVIQDRGKVLLFTRPRRMGKSLNMNTLATFLDSKQDTAHLFNRLYIESSPVFEQVNTRPVIYLSFKDFVAMNYRQRFKIALDEAANKYLNKEA